MNAKINDLELAARAIRENGGIAPPTIARARMPRGVGAKGQRGYKVGATIYATAAEIVSADAAAQRRYDDDTRMSDAEEVEVLLGL